MELIASFVLGLFVGIVIGVMGMLIMLGTIAGREDSEVDL